MKSNIFYIDLLIIVFIISIVFFVLPKVTISYNDSIRDAFLIALGIEITKLVLSINKTYIFEFKPTILFKHLTERDVTKFSREEDLLKRNEALIKNSLQKIQQNENSELRYIGIKELKSWAKQENVDKSKLAETLVEISAQTKDSYFKKVIIDIICKDYREFIKPMNHKLKIEVASTNK